MKMFGCWLQQLQSWEDGKHYSQWTSISQITEWCCCSVVSMMLV